MQVLSSVSKYFLGAVGKTITIEQIMKDLGLRDEQVRNTVRRLVNENRMDIDVIAKGHVWRINSAQPKANVEVKAKEIPPPANLLSDEFGNPKPVKEVKRATWERTGTWEIYEPVGKDKDGSQIVRDEDGNLYRLMPL